jgi:DNA-binding response OmpR family regulator
MPSDDLSIFVISKDLIFISLIEVMLNQYLNNPHIEKILSFNELKEKQTVMPPDVIILDDFIIGAASLEVITFIRYNRRFACPIFLFCESVTDIANNAIKQGANQYFTKPFNPESVVSEIVKSLK